LVQRTEYLEKLIQWKDEQVIKVVTGIRRCGYAQTWWYVIFPIARPGILTAAVLAFLNNWNEYYWASLVIIDKDKLTVPALLSTFSTSFRTNYNGLFSAMVVIILPPIILYCVFNKFFVEALSGGAVKG
jgi:raffinose/stachyose/melibiose transport system permease protein